jgi:hypothetical protein
VGGLAEAVGLLVLGAIYRQDLLQVTQVDTVSTVLVATCVVIPSLLASMLSRKVASGLIAGALVTPVMLTISGLYYAIAFGAQMVAGPELAVSGVVITLVGAALGLSSGALGALLGHRFAQRTR